MRMMRTTLMKVMVVIIGMILLMIMRVRRGSWKDVPSFVRAACVSSHASSPAWLASPSWAQPACRRPTYLQSVIE